MDNLEKLKKHTDDKTALLVKSKAMKKYIGTTAGSAIDVLITSSRSYLILDGRYTLEAKQYEDRFELVENTPAVSKKDNFSVIKEICSKHGIEKLKVESEAYGPVEYIKMFESDLEVLPFDEDIRKIKMIKSNSEIEILMEACKITDKIFEDTIKHIKVGMTENELNGWIHYYSMKYGAEKMSFDPVISSGERTAYPHARPTDRKIGKNEPIMIDFGIVYKGYQSDMTRTVFTGNPSEEMRKIYNIVKEAQQAGLDSIKLGMNAKEVDSAARNIIEKNGYGEYFDHGLGHGIGTDNGSELPKLNQSSDTILEDGMVMSCEPGVYIPGIGGVRIEDVVCIIDGKGIVLNKITKELTILEV